MELNGRQVGDIRKDHLERYLFARDMIGLSDVTLDVACGTAYGSVILSEVSGLVVGYDISDEALAFARATVESHNRKGRVQLFQGDLNVVRLPRAMWAVSFETIEHLQDPRPFLKELRLKCKHLIASVPNQAVMPFDPQRHRYHFKHYTIHDFADLLKSTGWTDMSLHHQAGKRSVVGDTTEGQTIIAVCS